jgi:hypothetical protein
MSRPSHLCICQYIQHTLPLLVECNIPSSRSTSVAMFECHPSNIHHTEC